MSNLIDFIRFTTGWEYVIAILAVFSFVAFWMLWQMITEERPAESEKSAQTREEDTVRSKSLQPGHSGTGIQARRQ